MSNNPPPSLQQALNVEGGNALRDAQTITVRDASADAPATVLSLSHNANGAASAGIGVRLMFLAESEAGDDVLAGAIVCTHTDVTDGAEVGMIKLAPGSAGDFAEGLKVQGVAAAVNGITITTAETTASPVVAAYGADTNISVAVRAKGSGAFECQAPGGTVMFSVGATGKLTVYTDTVITVGPTINRPAGIVQVPSASTTVTVTNSLVTTSSTIFCSIRNATTNAVSVLRAVPGAGSFVITLSGDPGASHASVGFLVVN